MDTEGRITRDCRSGTGASFCCGLPGNHDQSELGLVRDLNNSSAAAQELVCTGAMRALGSTFDLDSQMWSIEDQAEDYDIDGSKGLLSAHTSDH